MACLRVEHHVVVEEEEKAGGRRAEAGLRDFSAEKYS
jgi:hypothetical protein